MARPKLSSLTASQEFWSIDSDRLLLQSLITQFKHHSFAAEKEVRYITALENNDKLKFRSSHDRIIPYVNVSPCSDKPEPQQMITHVKIGPNARPGTNSVIQKLLETSNLNKVSILTSEVPYMGTR